MSCIPTWTNPLVRSICLSALAGREVVNIDSNLVLLGKGVAPQTDIADLCLFLFVSPEPPIVFGMLGLMSNDGPTPES